jgi:hypothetical protein
LKLLISYLKELINKSGEIVLYIHVGLIDISNFFINGELKLGLNLPARLIVKTFLYNFEKLVVSYERDTSKITLLL